MREQIIVLGYPTGKVKPLDNQRVMTEMFVAMQEAGFVVEGSTSWFTAQNEETTFVFQIDSE